MHRFRIGGFSISRHGFERLHSCLRRVGLLAVCSLLLNHVSFQSHSPFIFLSGAELSFAQTEVEQPLEQSLPAHLKQIVFKQAHGIRRGTPLYWRGDKVGVVARIQQDRDTHSVLVFADLNSPSLPESIAAVVANTPREDSAANGPRIELVPTKRGNGETVPGFGTFEEFWLSQK